MRQTRSAASSRLLARTRKFPGNGSSTKRASPSAFRAWNNPQDYARAIVNSYRRDYWQQQATRVEIWSEKGTVRGTLAPVLEEYGVTFRVMHGYSSATAVRQIADETANRPIIALYVGD